MTISTLAHSSPLRGRPPGGRDVLLPRWRSRPKPVRSGHACRRICRIVWLRRHCTTGVFVSGTPRASGHAGGAIRRDDQEAVARRRGARSHRRQLDALSQDPGRRATSPATSKVRRMMAVTTQSIGADQVLGGRSRAPARLHRARASASPSSIPVSPMHATLGGRVVASRRFHGRPAGNGDDDLRPRHARGRASSPSTARRLRRHRAGRAHRQPPVRSAPTARAARAT